MGKGIREINNISPCLHPCRRPRRPSLRRNRPSLTVMFLSSVGAPFLRPGLRFHRAPCAALDQAGCVRTSASASHNPYSASGSGSGKPINFRDQKPIGKRDPAHLRGVSRTSAKGQPRGRPGFEAQSAAPTAWQLQSARHCADQRAHHLPLTSITSSYGRAHSPLASSKSASHRPAGGPFPRSRISPRRWRASRSGMLTGRRCCGAHSCRSWRK
jgi:hypothetical protein